MNLLSELYNAFKAEQVKKRKTGFYLLAIILGAITPILYLTISLIQKQTIKEYLEINFWQSFVQESAEPFASFFFPLLIIIVTSRSAQLDHKNGGWQLMETQPVSKFSIYFSKLLTVMVANFISIATMLFFSHVCAYVYVLTGRLPESIDQSMLLMPYFTLMVRLFCAGLFLTILQFAIAVLTPSFIWAIVIGFSGLVLTPILRGFEKLPVWYPFNILAEVADNPEGSYLESLFTHPEKLGMLCFIFLLIVSYLIYKDKTPVRAFWGSKWKRAFSLTFLILFACTFSFMVNSNTTTPHSRTVLRGEIDSDFDVENICVLDRLTNDTLTQGLIKDKKFAVVLPHDLPVDYYTILIDGKVQLATFMGAKDSTYLKVKYKKGNLTNKVFGTRCPENVFVGNEYKYWKVNYYLKEDRYLDEPEKFKEILLEEYRDRKKYIDHFTTNDNYTPRLDFKTRNTKLLAAEYVDHWHEFEKKYKDRYPDKHIEAGKDIQSLKELVTLREENLITETYYRQFVINQLTSNDTSDIDVIQKNLKAISKLPLDSYRDKLLYTEINVGLDESMTGQKREELIQSNESLFMNAHYTEVLNRKKGLLNSLGKGEPAPLFSMVNSKGEKFTSEAFKGKYLIVDVWATWCGPCKYESPRFEKFARKYKDNNIVFLAGSVDENKTKWLNEVQFKSKSVEQFYITDQKEFMKKYSIEFIPAFLLINPEGKIVTVKMPRPSEEVFEILLRKELKLADEL